MDTKDLSPAYLTSLLALFAGALMVGASSTWVSVLGWAVLLAGMGLNVFATLVVVQHLKGGPLPAMIAGADADAQVEYEEEGAPDDPYLYEPEAITESQPLVSAAAPSAAASDERIFRSRAPRQHVR
ncbi:hypothetical protein QM007_00210 [Rothia sp. SD9660Na]|uniref:hypothetical protein n=1 Tax=Rothia sp. SD9660Na TaxID=3047030 RepID=UPI0024B89B01|nr:hypothetical protein [Rothia sp. SD9660Na]WHS50452.1 hypothetical protein QM007_00210 [Rothia sp. SD9660Na]